MYENNFSHTLDKSINFTGKNHYLSSFNLYYFYYENKTCFYRISQTNQLICLYFKKLCKFIL